MTDNIYSEEFSMALSFALGYIVLIGLVVSWVISDNELDSTLLLSNGDLKQEPNPEQNDGGSSKTLL